METGYKKKEANGLPSSRINSKEFNTLFITLVANYCTGAGAGAGAAG